MFKKIAGYFLKGILITIPIGVVLYLIYVTFISLDELIPWEKLIFWKNITKEDKPAGVGILILLSVITGIGALSSSLIFNPISRWVNSGFHKVIDRVPLLKTVYSAIHDLLTAFVGNKKKFNKPVLVELANGLEKMGFITDETLSHLGNPSDKVAVYFPFSFGVMGSLFFIKKDKITLLDKNSTELMKYIVSAGVSEEKTAREEK